MNLKPLRDYLIVDPIWREEVTASGIVIPEVVKDRPEEGIVIAIGPGHRDKHSNRVPMDVSIEDRVLFPKYAGTEIKIGPVPVLLLKSEDLLAIVEEK